MKRIGPSRFVRAEGPGLRLPADQDTPERLLKDLVERRLDPRDLSRTQRQAILLLQIKGKHTAAELASMLKVSPTQIRNDLREIRRQVGREVKDWSLEEVAGGMVLAAERYQARAVAQDDVALAWAIERDKVKLLQQIGLLGQREHEGGVRLTLEVMGKGYERTREILGKALDPRLTGQVMEDEPQGLLEPQLELPRALPGPEAEVPADGAPEAVQVEVLEPEIPAEDSGLEEEIQGILEGAPLKPAQGEELARLRRQHGHPETRARGS